MSRVVGIARSLEKSKMDAVQYYRCCLPIDAVGRADNGIRTELYGADVMDGSWIQDGEGIEPPDVLVMSRMYFDDYARFVDEVHKSGTKLVLDCDDDLLETHRLISGRGKEFEYVLGQADYVTTTTQYLADLFGEHTQRSPVVLKNCVDVKWMNSVAKEPDPGITRIGFSGSPTHWGDWKTASLGISRVLKEYKCDFLVHGFLPRYMKYVSYPEEVTLMSMVEYAVYPYILGKFSILACAVDPTDGFNFGKSAVKALEAMAIGVVPVCSNFGPYAELKERGAPVIIVEEETSDCWYETVRSLLRGDMTDDIQGGVEWVLRNRDMVQGGYRQWENFFRSVINEVAN